MSDQITLNDRIDKYKKYLEEPFWELHEAAYLLCGIIDFEINVFLTDKEVETFKRKTYNLGPSCLLRNTESKKNIAIEKLHNTVLDSLIHSVKNRDIYSSELPLYWNQDNKNVRFIEYNFKQTIDLPHFKNHTYFLLPIEAIYVVASQGICLPIELQMASKIYQIPTSSTNPLSKGQINKVKRDTVSQVYWWSFPNESISGICRKLVRLKACGGFEFLHSSNYEDGKRDTNMKPRDSVKQMKPKASGEIIWISGVLQRNDGLMQIDFQKLKIVFQIVMNLMLLKEPYIQLEDFLAHPLIYLYMGKDKGRISINDAS